MDSIDSLPIDDNSQLNDAQKMAMHKYVGAPAEPKSKWSDGNKWKLIGYLTVLFILIANPWSQSLLNKVPYFGGNEMTMTLLSGIVFAVGAIIVVMFL